MTDTTPRACGWEIDGLRYAGLEWGEAGGAPVLALHGWMDHADSFRELAPRLTGCHVVALDTSGFGQSAHRAAHATYNIWDDIPQIVQVADRLGWDRFALLGHSRGANISTLMAAALPDRVQAVIALDAVAVEPARKTVPETLRAFVLETLGRRTRAPRVFDTRESYVARRAEQGNAPAVAEALADRALDQVAGGYRMTADPRHFASSAVKLTREQIEDVLRAIRCPVLTLWATDGIRARFASVAETAEMAARLIADYETRDIPGDHHFHMDPGAAQSIADAVADFLSRHRRA